METKQPWGEASQDYPLEMKGEFFRDRAEGYRMDRAHELSNSTVTQGVGAGQPSPPNFAIPIPSDESVDQKNSRKRKDYDPKLHYSRYKSGSPWKYVDLTILIVIIIVAFMFAVHIPKYILENTGFQRHAGQPDSPAFIVCYIILAIVLFPLIILILALPARKHKYIIYKTKRILRL